MYLRRIESRDNPRYKALMKSIAQPRLLRREGLAVAEGIHLLQELLAWPDVEVREVWLSIELREHREWPAVVDALQTCGADLYELDAALYQRLSEFEHGVGPLVLFSVPHGGVSAFSAQQPPQRDILLLDGIQDPGNVGTLIRTAAAAGLAEVWTTPDCAWPYGSKVLRAGMGGHRQLRVITAPDDAMECLTQWGQAGVPIRAMRLDGARSLYETGLQPPGVWLLGSEGQGLSETLSALANEHLFIPMASPLESLNVAAAAAVCLFEQYRQRGLPRIGTSA